MENLSNLTGAEKVLYKAHYEYAINTLMASKEEARSMAMDKIEKKRKLANKVSRH